MGYGGDFEPAGKPHAGAFCLNGLIFPDRTIQPALWEVKKQYQSIHLKMMDFTELTFEVYNENFFINLSEYDLEWEVLENEYRTDVRWLELKNKENQVFRFYSKQYLNFNVNHFNNEDFEPNGKNRHNTDIVTRKHTNLNIDYKQMGVGGDTIWGALPYQQYLIYPEPMKYTFIIEPLLNK